MLEELPSSGELRKLTIDRGRTPLSTSANSDTLCHRLQAYHRPTTPPVVGVVGGASAPRGVTPRCIDAQVTGAGGGPAPRGAKQSPVRDDAANLAGEIFRIPDSYRKRPIRAGGRCIARVCNCTTLYVFLGAR